MSSSGSQKVLSPAGEPEGLEPHRLQGTVPGKDHQIRPREIPAVFLLNRPEQPARLVEARVVGPTVEGRKAERAGGCAAASVVDAVGACTVPRHPNEERTIVAIVGGPPLLRCRHHLIDVLLQRLQVNCLERLGVIEILPHRIGLGRVLVEYLQVQLIRPPVLVRYNAPWYRVAHHWTLTFAAHIASNRVPYFFQTVGFFHPLLIVRVTVKG